MPKAIVVEDEQLEHAVRVAKASSNENAPGTPQAQPSRRAEDVEAARLSCPESSRERYMIKRIEPRSECDYTTRQIVELLDLRDSACLSFIENGIEQCIQTSHCGEHMLLGLPLWPDALWTYRYETSEWVPIFRWSKANTIGIDELVDKVPDIDPFAERPGALWCTPKGQPREQFHRIVADETGEYITDDSGDRYPLPQFDEEGHSEHFYTRVNNPGICNFCKQQVEKRVNYRDPEDGGYRRYEICRPCLDRQMAQAREADAMYDN